MATFTSGQAVTVAPNATPATVNRDFGTDPQTGIVYYEVIYSADSAGVVPASDLTAA